MKTAKNHNIHAKVASKGHCCVWGYLETCRLEGKSANATMTPLGLSRLTFYHHCEKVKNGTHTCQGKKSCLFPKLAPQRIASGGGHDLENLRDVGASAGGGMDSPGTNDGNRP